MRALFLIPDDFPESGACTVLLRNLLFTGGLKNTFDEVAVMGFTGAFTRAAEELDGVCIYRTPLFDRRSLRGCIYSLPRHPWKAGRVLVYKVLDALQNKFWTPEMRSVKVREIFRALGDIGAESYDVIVPILGDIHIAAAAMKLKQARPEMKLVLYQVDPYASNHALAEDRRSQRMEFERELFQISDRIITTPLLYKEAKLRHSDAVVDKMEPMEFPGILSRPDVAVPAANDQIRCVFAGSIYGNIRDPEYTYALFSRLDPAVRMEMIGQLSKTEKNRCDAYGILSHGYKSPVETGRELVQADILVNIGNRMRNQVPSKLFDYISYGKPIVNVCKNRDCPSCDYLDKYPCAINLFEEEGILDQQRDLLRAFLLENRDKRIPSDHVRELFITATPEYCAAQMAAVIRAATLKSVNDLPRS